MWWVHASPQSFGHTVFIRYPHPSPAITTTKLFLKSGSSLHCGIRELSIWPNNKIPGGMLTSKVKTEGKKLWSHVPANKVTYNCCTVWDGVRDQQHGLNMQRHEEIGA